MSVLISIKSFYRNIYQVGNLYTNAIIGHHHKRARATVIDNNRRCYGNNNRGEGMMVMRRSKVKTIISDSKNDSLRYNLRESKN